MKKIMLVISLFILGWTAPLSAEVMTYQGRLKESNVPANANRSFLFEFCATETPTGCVASADGAKPFAVQNGLFKSTFTMPAVDLSAGPWYLRVQVEGSYLSPVERLTFVPYSLYASTAGYSPAALQKAGDTMTGQLTISGSSLTVVGTQGIWSAASTFAGNVVISSASAAVYGGIAISTHVYLPPGAVYYGDGSGLIGITGASGTDSSKLPLTGGTLSGQLTLSGSTLTVTGDAFSVGGSTLVVTNGYLGLGTNAPTARLHVVSDNGYIHFASPNSQLIMNMIPQTYAPVILNNNGDGPLAFSIGNAEQMRIDRQTLVGIGTPTPFYRLHVSSGAGEAGTILAVSTGATNIFTVDGSGVKALRFTGDGSGLTGVTGASGTDSSKLPLAGGTMSGQLTNTSSVTISGNGGGAYGLQVSSNVSLAGVLYSANGNVGIGTTSPGSRFEVVGGSSTFRGSNSNSAIAGFTDAGGNYRVVISTSGNVVISDTGAGALDVAGGINAGTGNVGIVDATGKIPALSAIYLADLSGANLTNLMAANLSGTVPQNQVNLSTVTTALAGKVGLADVNTFTSSQTITAPLGLLVNYEVKAGSAAITADLDVNGVITAGSGNNQITTVTGLLDVTKLSADLAYTQVDAIVGQVAGNLAAGDDNRFPAGEDIVNADIGAAAGIVYSKLSLTGAVVNGDLAASGFDAGKFTMGSLSTDRIPGTIVSTHIAAGAAIAYSKLSIADGDLTIAKTSGLQMALDSKAALSGINTWTSSQTIKDPLGLSVSYGVTAATAVITNTGANALNVAGGINAGSGNFGSVTTLSSGTFKAVGANQFSVETSSGILVQAGRIQAPAILLTNGAAANYVLTSDAAGNANWVNPVDGWVGNEITDAADGTLVRSGTGTAVGPYKIGLNLASNNSWTGVQGFTNGLTGTLSGAASLNVLKGGDTMTGPLTLAGSTLTVTGDAFSVGGSTLVVTNGYLGLGTNAPTARLHVVSDNGYIHFASPNSQLIMNMIPQTYAPVILNNNGDGPLAFSIGNAEQMRIDRQTLVGIGTGAPAYRLHISSGAGESGTILAVSTGATNIFTVDGSGVKALRFTGDGSGLTGVTGASGTDSSKLPLTGGTLAGQLTLAGSTLTVTGSAFSVGGSTLVVMNGNLGLGTANPGARLDVAGSGNFSGSVTASSSGTFRAVGANQFSVETSSGIFVQAGRIQAPAIQLTNGAAANYVLTSDAAGNANWINPVDGWVGNEITDAADGTLVRSGTGTAVGPYKIGLNLASTNTWTGTHTFTSGLAGTLTGNADTVTNGVYTAASYADPAWITSLGTGKINLSTVTARFDAHSAFISSFTANTDGRVLKAGDIMSGQLTNTSSVMITGNGGGAYGLQVSSNISLAGALYSANGNVGIGTAGPGAKLDVAGVIRSTNAIFPGDGLAFQSSRGLSDDSANYRTIFSSNVYMVGYSSAAKYYGDGSGLINLLGPGNMATTDTSQVISGTKTFTGQLVLNSTLAVIAPTNAASSLWVSTSVTTPHLYVSTSGNVGIGTASPVARINVNFTFGGEDPLSLFGINGLGDTLKVDNNGRLQYQPSVNMGATGDSVNFGGNQTICTSNCANFFSINPAEATTSPLFHVLRAGASRMVVTATGNVGIGTPAPGANLHILSISTSATQDMLKVTTGTANADVFVVKGSGNVGIGTSNPMAKLHVSGGTTVFEGEVAITTNSASGGSHLRSSQPTPPGFSATNPGCGTTPNGSVNGTDMAGTVTLTASTAPSGTCRITVNFVRQYATAPKAVLITPMGANAHLLNASINPVPTISNFSIQANATVSPLTTYSWSYIVIE